MTTHSTPATILDTIRANEGTSMSAAAIARTIGMSPGTVRRHLNALLDAGVVDYSASAGRRWWRVVARALNLHALAVAIGEQAADNVYQAELDAVAQPLDATLHANAMQAATGHLHQRAASDMSIKTYDCDVCDNKDIPMTDVVELFCREVCVMWACPQCRPSNSPPATPTPMVDTDDWDEADDIPF